MMRTTYTIYYPDDTTQVGEIDWPQSPTLDQIKALLQPVIGDHVEHVRVLDPAEDDYRDMFVDELGHDHGKPRNNRATEIYRHNWLSHEGGEPEDLSWIAGTAVVFDRIIWS
jgi:hypothetical protein